MPVIIDDSGARFVAPAPTVPTAPPLSAGLSGFAAPASALLTPPTAAQVISTNPAGGQGVALTEAQRLPVTAPATALVPVSIDPVDLVDGQIWIRSDLNEIRFRDGGITYKIAGVVA